MVAAEPGGTDAAGELRAEVGGELVAEVEVCLSDGPSRVWVEDGDVGVVAGSEGAFLGSDAGETGRGGGEPVGELREGASAGLDGGPENGKCQAERGDATPCEVETAGFW